MSRYCSVCESEKFSILREIAKLQGEYSPREKQKILRTKELAEQKWEEAQKELEKCREKLKKREEELFSEVLEKTLEGKSSSQEIAQMIVGNKERQELMKNISTLELVSKEVTYEDWSNLLKNYEREGYLKIEKGKLRLTSRGAQLLGRGFLKKIMQNMVKRGIGTQRVEEIGFGSTFSRLTRSYAIGDTYDRINIEKTLVNVLEKGRRINEFSIDDIEVYEPLHQSKLNIGIIIDGSGSMHGKLFDAAIEVALALSELIRTYFPQDKLRTLIFSEQVREIQPWELLNIKISRTGWTNIKDGIRSYRILWGDGEKQAYLITDSRPNYENGKYVGFSQAARGVLEEASKCRKENVTLNIVMLDQSYRSKEFASMIAKQNIGRVIFTSPENLGEAILEDYLISKNERLLCSK